MQGLEHHTIKGNLAALREIYKQKRPVEDEDLV